MNEFLSHPCPTNKNLRAFIPYNNIQARNNRHRHRIHRGRNFGVYGRRTTSTRYREIK
jgi:hypothetical protein